MLDSKLDDQPPLTSNNLFNIVQIKTWLLLFKCGEEKRWTWSVETQSCSCQKNFPPFAPYDNVFFLWTYDESLISILLITPLFTDELPTTLTFPSLNVCKIFETDFIFSLFKTIPTAKGFQFSKFNFIFLFLNSIFNFICNIFS